MTGASSSRRTFIVGVAASALGPGCAKNAGSSLERSLLALSSPAGDAPRALAVWQARAQAHLVGDRTGGVRGAVLATMFGDGGFVREVDDKDPRFMLLSPVLASRRGSCVGLGTLAIVLARRLGARAEALMVPGHFFVRLPDGEGRLHNAELLRRGEEMPEAWYRERYGVGVQGAYLRPLCDSEILAVVDFNLGNHWRVQGALDEAARHYERAARAFPTFAEAHASLGLVRHLQGDRAGAAAAYETARRFRPDLPGLAENLAVLHSEPETRNTRDKR